MKKTAIVIDDHDFCRDLLGNYLREKGYIVMCADSASSCELYNDKLFKCSKEKPCSQVLLTDNQMPEINGLDLIARQMGGGCKVPMQKKAVISGTWTQDELTQAENMGCKVFYKPFDLAEIDEWLEQHESSSSLSDSVL